MKDVKGVAILGAGNGGITAAADLKEKGFHIRLYELPEFGENLNVIKEKGGILLQESDKESFQKIDIITTNIEEAIKDAEIIMLTIPGFAVETFAELLAPIVEENQVILLNGAAAMGCIRFINKAKELGINKEFKIAEE